MEMIRGNPEGAMRKAGRLVATIGSSRPRRMWMCLAMSSRSRPLRFSKLLRRSKCLSHRNKPLSHPNKPLSHRHRARIQVVSFHLVKANTPPKNLSARLLRPVGVFHSG